MERKIETPANLELYPPDDLLDEYTKLYKDFMSLRNLREEDIQENYELKRNIKLLQSSSSELQNELEYYMSSSSGRQKSEKISQKLEVELEDLKRKYSENESYVTSLEVNIERLEEEKRELKDQLLELINVVPQEAKIPNDYLERELAMEKENTLLLEKVDECQMQLNNYMMAVGEREKQIEILKDQVQCLEENYSSKKDELEEKIDLLESAQEQVMELNAKVAMLSATPDEMNRKGNSLFAEVDDQRQEMKSLLAAQKNQFLQMKKHYTESEHEIRKLKREKAAMHSELQRCMSIFLNADKFLKERLNQRINQLSTEKDILSKKLNSTEEQMKQMASDKGVNWMETMLDYCKKQTEEIKKQLQTCRREKQIVDGLYHDSEKEMAKWRFEALKNRCIIIDRESILEKNSIPFKIFKNPDYNISKKTIEEATPKISYEEVANESVKFDVYVDKEIVARTPLRPTTCPKEDKENSPYFVAAELPIRKSGTPFKGSPLLDRHLSPRFPKSLSSSLLSPKVTVVSPKVNVVSPYETPTKGHFEVYEDSTSQNIATELRRLESRKEEIEKNDENKENDMKEEAIENFEDLNISDVKVKQEVKSGSTVVVRRVFIPSSSKDKF
ncbi:hypothetical protein ACFFRR_004818 [Megaselia abdita]